MPDRVFYPLVAIVAVAMIGLSLVWPQGQGRHSPWPFGHEPAKPAPTAAAAPSPAAVKTPAPQTTAK